MDDDRQLPDSPPSKSQKKRDMQALQEIGERLTRLKPRQLDELALPEALRLAVDEARRISAHGALRRQYQFIGKLMREVDPEPIRERLAAWDGTSVSATARHKELERWRERLLADDAAATEYASQHPGADLARLRTLVRNARREQAAGSPPHAYRALFRALTEAGAGPEPAPASEEEQNDD